jgi:hypothetical protein
MKVKSWRCYYSSCSFFPFLRLRKHLAGRVEKTSQRNKN